MPPKRSKAPEGAKKAEGADKKPKKDGAKKDAAKKPAPKKKPVAKAPARLPKGDAAKGKASDVAKAKVARGASGAVKKAKIAQYKVVRGPHGTRTKKIRTNIRWRMPKTLKLKRNPKYPRKSTPSKPKFDEYSVIRYPLTTEAAMKLIEDNNTLVFIVDRRCNKYHIKSAVKKMYEIDAVKINTLNRPDGLKKAFVKLAPDYDALDVANKIGII